MTPTLPVDEVLADLLVVLERGSAAVLQAPPGAGKTTRVPLALLDAPWLAGQTILMLEPRRLAASNAARYMAQLLGEEVGGRVGYTIRYERRVSPATRVEVVTEGILTRRLQDDPELTGVGLVIFDEFHERNLHSDLALALCRDVQLNLRDELKLLVMSATLDAGPVAQLLGGVPLLSCSGRSHPVEVSYLVREPSGPLSAYLPREIRRILKTTSGDVLVFLPGVGDINRCAAGLADLAPEIDLRPLHGSLPFAAQERAILPGTRRKLVLATNIAETSLTIEGVTVVVDGGLERRPRYDAARGVTLLETLRISQASATQRAGRAGRLGPGRCYRLWTEGQQGALIPFAPPEIRSADLTGLLLELTAWGVSDPATLAWLDPPPAGHLAGASTLLQRLGALDTAGRLTRLGRRMAALPTHPRLARLLVAAMEEGGPGLGADLVALLSERELPGAREAAEAASASDLLGRLALLPRSGSSPAGRAARYWRDRLAVRQGGPPAEATTIGRLLAVAFPDRIACEREPGSGRYLLSNGAGARLSPHSAVKGGTWLVAVEVEGRAGEEYVILQASRLDKADVEDLFGAGLTWQREVEWLDAAERVAVREVRRLGALVLQERPAQPDGDDVVAALLALIRRRGLGLLGWGPGERQLRARVAFLSRLDPEGGWPDLSDRALLAGLEGWLAPLLRRVRTRDGLRQVSLLPALREQLDWEQRRRLDSLAPESLEVPSGSVVRLDYAAEDGPVLAVKLQELFGLAETPRVAGGRAAVQIHLLSPAGRPLAVTRDLRTFWSEVYPEVRKEMQGRYPKHPWPEDPLRSLATRKTRAQLRRPS